MRSKSGFQPSVAVIKQGGAVDRAAKSDAAIADVKCTAHVLNVIRMCIHKSQTWLRLNRQQTRKSDVDAFITDVKCECDQNGHIG